MITNTYLGTATVSAMDFRKQPGTYLDQVDLRQLTFIIERAGKKKAALISMLQFEQFKRYQSEAKARLFKKIDKIRMNTSAYSPNEIKSAINEAI